MTIEAYRIAVSLVVNDNAATAIGEFRRQFEALDALATRVQARLRQMTGDFAPLKDTATAAAKAWQAAADAMERAHKAAASMGAPPHPGSYGPGVAPAGPVPAGPRVIPPLLALPYMAPGAPGGGGLVPYGGGGVGGPPPQIGYGGIPLIPPSGGSLALLGSTMWRQLSPLAKAYLGYTAMRHAFTAEMTAGQIESGLMMQGFSAAEAEGAYSAAARIQQGVPGTSLIGNLNLIAKLMAVTQDRKASMELMPEFARMGAVLDSFGKGGEGDALFAAIRAGEFRGVLTSHDEKTGQEHVDNAKLTNFVRMMTAATLITKGSIGPAQFYQFLKSGGISSTMIDDQSLFADSIAMQLAMGSANAGTALQGFGMQFSAGKMSQAAASLLISMGLISHPERMLSNGMGNYMLMPGSMEAGHLDMLRDKPTEFIMKVLLPHIRGFLSGRSGVDIDSVLLPISSEGENKKFRRVISEMDTKAYREATPERQRQMEIAFFQTLASRIPGGKEMAEVVRNILLIERDRTAMAEALKRDPYGIAMATNPALRARALGAAYEAFEIAAMRVGEEPMIKGLGIATDFLNMISNVLRLFDRSMAGREATTPAPVAPDGKPFGFWNRDFFSKEFWLGAVGSKIELHGDVKLDGEKVGTVIGRGLNRPQGVGSSDPRVSPYGAAGAP